MRRLLLVSLSLLAGSALAAPAAQASANPVEVECNRIFHCTVYGPSGEVIISYDQIGDDPIETECNRIFHCTVYGPNDEPITSVDAILALLEDPPPIGS